jgi:hypothetical protein
VVETRPNSIRDIRPRLRPVLLTGDTPRPKRRRFPRHPRPVAVPHPASAPGSVCSTAVRLTSAHPVRRSRK